MLNEKKLRIGFLKENPPGKRRDVQLTFAKFHVRKLAIDNEVGQKMKKKSPLRYLQITLT